MNARTFRAKQLCIGLLFTSTSGLCQAIEPSDPFYKNSMYFGPMYYQWGMQALNLEKAWDLSRGHAYLATVDSGIDTNHPDLTNNYRPQFSFDFGSCDKPEVSYRNLGKNVYICKDDEAVAGDDNADENEIGDDGFFTDAGNPVAGHGTHVAGIMAATANNNIGTAGVCWSCSIMTAKVKPFRPKSFGDMTGYTEPTVFRTNQAEGIRWAVDNGAQVINLSFGAATDDYLTDDELSCSTLPRGFWNVDPKLDAIDNRRRNAAAAYCDALAYAEEFDVVLVASAGNGVRTFEDKAIHFPASDPRTIAVGAIDVWGNTAPLAKSIAVSYDQINPQFQSHGNCPSKYDDCNLNNDIVEFSSGPEKDLVAPGFNILSTFYSSSATGLQAIWNNGFEEGHPYFKTECADDIAVKHGYGPCSGTSMAAPHISGLAGLLRSVNPLLKKNQIKSALIKHASRANARDDDYGYGLPDAFKSVKDVLGESNGRQLTNRVTPLFSLYSSTGQDHLYTTNPQMAMAAIYGALQPQPETPITWSSDYYDPYAIGYRHFPKPGFFWNIPRASTYILTTYANPIDPSIDLVPLYRLSRSRANGSVTNNVDHTYATLQHEIDDYVANGYQLDGIEGYIFPTSYNEDTKPEGTVKLYRKYNRTRDDHAIFPENKLSTMTSSGYTENSGRPWIGYVYPSQDSDWDGLVDGFERIAGTDISDKDSDDDGISDGVEINNYPYSDPRDNPLIP